MRSVDPSKLLDDGDESDSEPPAPAPAPSPGLSRVSPVISPRQRTTPTLIDEPLPSALSPPSALSTSLRSTDSLDALTSKVDEIAQQKQRRELEALRREAAALQAAAEHRALSGGSPLAKDGEAIMEELFASFDENGDGIITKEEFKVAVQRLSSPPQGQAARYSGSASDSDSYVSAALRLGNSPGSSRGADSPSREGAVAVMKHGVRTGEGTYSGPMLRLPDGAMIKHGDDGEMHYSNGEWYRGGWAEDRPEGPAGSYTNAEGQKYNGPWQEGLFHGPMGGKTPRLFVFASFCRA